MAGKPKRPPKGLILIIGGGPLPKGPKKATAPKAPPKKKG